MEVTSELLPSFERDVDSKPSLNKRNVISKFSFISPLSKANNDEKSEIGKKLVKDADGDYLVERRHPRTFKEESITLEHSISTELSLVGLQIWRGALLLADFVIHHSNLFQDLTVLELGAGVGLTSVVAAMFAKEVVCTDINLGDILKLIKSNLERNQNLIKAQLCVHGLDFFDQCWTPELEAKVKEVSIVLAADVIYDNDVTEAFVNTVTKIMSIPPKKTLYVALEKRYVFTIADLDSIAPCYEHLLSCLEAARSQPPFSQWTMEFVSLDFPQYFNYERTKQLVMFKISS